MNGHITFEYQFDDVSPKVTMTMHPEADLGEVIENFEMFLRGAGYAFDGYLDFVEETIPTPEEN